MTNALVHWALPAEIDRGSSWRAKCFFQESGVNP